MNLNVTDLRKNRRRSLKNQKLENKVEDLDRRSVSDRRIDSVELGEAEENSQRIWLTPGERTLIEDLYLLDDNNKSG